MKKNKQAFTLVELIVVITILAILGTIAFITLQGYSAQARDSKRLSDIQNIKKSLELFSLNTGKYPLPDNGKEIEYEGDLVWTQGIVGNNVTKNLNKNLSKKPKDPKTELEYTYSLINSGNKYEVLSIYESNLVGQNMLINKSFATSSDYHKIDGTYNGIFVKTSHYYIPTPSIINSEVFSSIMLLNKQNIKSQIISGGKNKLGVGLSKSSTGELDIKLVAYTGSIINKSDDSEKQKLAEIIQEAYAGGSLANKGVYKKILETTELEDLVNLVDNIVLNSANVSTSNTIVTCDNGKILDGNTCRFPNSCKEILSKDSSVLNLNGFYTIDPELTGIGFQIYCDMTTDGGGWSLVGKRTNSTTNVASGVCKTYVLDSVGYDFDNNNYGCLSNSTRQAIGGKELLSHYNDGGTMVKVKIDRNGYDINFDIMDVCENNDISKPYRAKIIEPTNISTDWANGINLSDCNSESGWSTYRPILRFSLPVPIVWDVYHYDTRNNQYGHPDKNGNSVLATPVFLFAR